MYILTTITITTSKQVTDTKHHLRWWLGRQPEDDKCEERQQNARQNEHVVVEGSDSLEWDDKCEVGVRLRTARVIFHVLMRRMTQDFPLIACRVIAYVNLHSHLTRV